MGIRFLKINTDGDLLKAHAKNHFEIIAQLLQKNEATYLPLKNCCKVMRNMLNRVLREPEKRTPTL